MRLYFDERVPLLLCALLGEHGIDCLSTQAAGNLGLSDDAQLAFAGRKQRTILTFDRKDFLQLAALWQETGHSHAGILLSREVPLPELLRRLRRFFRRHRSHQPDLVASRFQRTRFALEDCGTQFRCGHFTQSPHRVPQSPVNSALLGDIR